MEKANLPTQKACEPKEEAHQPAVGKKNMTSNTGKRKDKINLKITFHEADTEKTCSQSSINTYKKVLSQPTPGLSHRQKLEWLQKRRGVGLWVQCDECDRWRFLPQVLDSHELPKNWFCHMNPDKTMSDCSVAEDPLKVCDEEDLVHGEYAAGSVVWARMQGWPWWPAMVDDCPDTEQYYWLDGFSDIPTHYNVVFFDATEVTRGWISPENLKPYNANKKSFRHLLGIKKFKNRLQTAISQADDAVHLDILNRLAQYSFIVRYNGPICKPRKISKKVLKKHQKRLQKQFKVDFPVESSTESDDDNNTEKSETIKRKKTKIELVGTPKAKKVMSTVISKTAKCIGSTAEDTVVEDKEVQETANADKKIIIQKPTKKLSALIGEAIDKLQDSLLDSSNASAIVNHSGVKDSLFGATQATGILVPETATDTNDTNFEPDETRELGSPRSDDFEF